MSDRKPDTTTPDRHPITFEVIPGTDIAEIREAHPDWSEDECRSEQSRVAGAAFRELLRINTQ